MFRKWPPCSCGAIAWWVKHKLQPIGEYAFCANCNKPSIIVGLTARHPKSLEPVAREPEEPKPRPNNRMAEVRAVGADTDMRWGG